ncbi:Ubiquitin carboxyl-terminal hydrolase [Aphelenchoides besseyi]|nr:Ubiquitin carboxyl-terminal hydrolase [Aphelenchoides besseyi]KAI6209414.1 Ubiquitin carboxyl-terminal hydrolase [Aphelenchoides besseyi]
MDLKSGVPNFSEVMGFNASHEVMYEDDADDTSIPAIQKITKKNNVLPLHGSDTTMNLNMLVYENICQSSYFKNYLSEVTDFQQAVDEVYYNVAHLEPWERGTRKTHALTGMCGGVRGVGAGGVISTAFCVLYKMFTMHLTRKQLVGMINSVHSVYLRGIGFLYIRYTQPPADLWSWFESYLDDEEEIDPRSGGGETMTVGQLVRQMMTKLDWYGTLFPRIPVPIQKDIEQKLGERSRAYNRQVERKRGARSPQRSSGGHGSNSGVHKRTRCAHHLRHHHCRKHRNKCPSKAKKQREKAIEERKAES